jgi:hypothetical protein
MSETPSSVPTLYFHLTTPLSPLLSPHNPSHAFHLIHRHPSSVDSPKGYLCRPRIVSHVSPTHGADVNDPHPQRQRPPGAPNLPACPRGLGSPFASTRLGMLLKYYRPAPVSIHRLAIAVVPGARSQIWRGLYAADHRHLVIMSTPCRTILCCLPYTTRYGALTVFH